MAEKKLKQITINLRGGLNDILRGLEKKLITEALKIGGGNKAEAARLLQIQRTSLVEKMRWHGMKLNTPDRAAYKPEPGRHYGDCYARKCEQCKEEGKI